MTNQEAVGRGLKLLQELHEMISAGKAEEIETWIRGQSLESLAYLECVRTILEGTEVMINAAHKVEQSPLRVVQLLARLDS